MEPFVAMLLLTAGAGACIPIGALLALPFSRKTSWMHAEARHFVIAFGGGILVAAVSLVLLPQGADSVGDPLSIVVWFVAGGLMFFALERHLGLRRRESPQFAATLLDYVPESLALGGMFAIGSHSAPLLAVLIGLQNLPEGFNSFLERISIGNNRPGTVLLQMTLLVALGPVLGALGWHFLAMQPYVLGSVMLTASGGILYLIFQDIAPMSRLDRHWFPPLGAVCGFGVALLGQRLVGA